MSDQIYILNPFAYAGDKNTVPQTDGTGAANFEDGYGIKYSQDPNTTGLALDRGQMNYLLNILFAGVQAIQELGAPEWIQPAQNGGSMYPYPYGAMDSYDDGFGFRTYFSSSDNNANEPVLNPATWVPLDGYNQLLERASPAFTGIPTAPTAADGTDTTQLATTAFVQNAVAGVRVLAQVVFDGDGSITIVDSHNVSGVVRDSAGLYTITFSPALPNADYGVQISNLTEFGGNNGSIYSTTGKAGSPELKTTTQLQICTGSGTSREDNGYLTVTIFGA